MGGSPGRGPNKSQISQLNCCKSTQDFQAELVRLIRIDLPETEVFFGGTGSDSRNLQVPTWVKADLERHPGLAMKLEQGAMVGISHAEQSLMPRPAGVARSNVVLIPVMDGDTLCGAIGLISAPDGPHLSAEDIEAVRQLAREAAPVLVRLQEIQALKAEHLKLTVAAERGARSEAMLSKAIEERNQLDSLLKVGWHVQGNMAHDLRTPLAAIRGYARMILDGRTGQITETQREYLAIINENTNRLIHVADWMTYLMDLSTQQFRLGTCDIRAMWSDALHKNEELLVRRSVKLTEHIPDESFEIIADGAKIAYALNELIVAAGKLSESGAEITVEFSRGRQHEVTVKISATGSAIPQDTINRLFDRSINNRRKATPENAEDLPVSLDGAHEVIAMHGGRIFVNSTSGQGFTLLFTLPAITVGGEDKSNEQAVNISRR